VERTAIYVSQTARQQGTHLGLSIADMIDMARESAPCRGRGVYNRRFERYLLHVDEERGVLLGVYRGPAPHEAKAAPAETGPVRAALIASRDSIEVLLSITEECQGDPGIDAAQADARETLRMIRELL